MFMCRNIGYNYKNFRNGYTFKTVFVEVAFLTFIVSALL